MVEVTVADWSRVLAAFESFFTEHGRVESGPQHIGFTAARVASGVTLHRSGRLAAHMPLHEVELLAETVTFDHELGELRVGGRGGRYLYRRPQ